MHTVPRDGGYYTVQDDVCIDWTLETLEYIRNRGRLCNEAGVLAALKNDGLSTPDAAAVVDGLHAAGFVRWTTVGMEVTPTGKTEIERRREIVDPVA